MKPLYPGPDGQMSRRRFLAMTSLGLSSLPFAPGLKADGAVDFYFTRLSYDSGDWDVDERAPSNILNALIEYTTLRVDLTERVVPLADPRMLTAPFCYLAGRRLVRFNHAERENFVRYVQSGGFVLVDDCNHDIDGLFAQSFEQQMAELFGPSALQRLNNDHPLYSSFFEFDGPPRTSQELNGWGDGLVHNYLRAIVVNGRIAVLYSNKDYGCEWDYDFRNKRFMVDDNTRFAVNVVVYAMTA